MDNIRLSITDRAGNSSSISIIIKSNSKKEPGLYDINDNLTKSWDDLINEGVLNNNNGVLTTNFSSGFNNSSDYLNGKLVISDEITSIGANGFTFCNNLIDVYIPDTVTSIGDATFSNCENLTNVRLSNNITNIESHVFNECKNLKNLVIPDSVINMSPYALNNCENIESLYVGKNAKLKLVNVSVMAFKNVPKLTVTIDEENSYHTIQDNIIFDKDSKTLICWVNAKGSITIPKNTVVIDEYAFAYVENVEHIIIQEGVTTIKYQAFYNRKTSNIQTITIPDSVTSIVGSAFNKIQHIYYTGTATGSPWGALAIN